MKIKISTSFTGEKGRRVSIDRLIMQLLEMGAVVVIELMPEVAIRLPAKLIGCCVGCTMCGEPAIGTVDVVVL